MSQEAFFSTTPTAFLADLQDVFLGLSEGLVTIDQVQCAQVAEDLGRVVEQVAAMEALTRAYLATEAEPVVPLRTPAARRSLARLAVPLDPERKILAFPQVTRIAITTAAGGAA